MSSLLTKPLVQHRLSRVSPIQLRDFPLLGRSHVSFRGLGDDPRKMVDRVEDAVTSDLCDINVRSSDCLVSPFLHLVQQVLLWLAHAHFWPYSGGVDARDLQKSLHDESTPVGMFSLNFKHPPGANNHVFRGD